MTVPDLPFVGQTYWGSPLNAGIVARTSSDYLADKLAEDGPFRSSLMSTIATGVEEQLPDLAPLIVDDYLAQTTVVASAEVRRIVAAEVGTTPVLQDGDMVVYYTRPGAHYFTDFTTDALDTTPAGWSQPWNPFPGAAPTVQAVPDAVGGRALAWQHASSNGNRALLAWHIADADEENADVEVLLRIRSAQASVFLPAIAARASGDNATATGYRAGHHDPAAVSISSYTNGSWNSSTLVTVEPVEADVWYLMRARFEGNTQKYKIWKDGDPEPDWTIESTMTQITQRGWIGLLYHGLRARTEVDWIAAATAGRTAVPV